MIRWIFLDMGNVVMNDDPVMAYLYRLLYEELQAAGVGVSFTELLREREALIQTRGVGHWSILTAKYLGSDALATLMKRSASELRANYLGYHNVIPGMDSAVRELSTEFSLAIVANQMREAAAALESVGLRDCFRFLGLSEELGIAKPNRAIYEWALVRAGATPREVVMVGDRIDNDVVPAREVGLWTVWFHPRVEAKGFHPPDDLSRAHHNSQRRASVAELGPTRPEEEPDGEACSAEELLHEVRLLRERSRLEG